MKRILIALAAGVAMLTTSAKINDTQGFESDRAAFVAAVGDEDSSEITSYGTEPGNVPYPLTSSGNKYLSFDTGDTTVWYSNTLDSAYFDMDIQLNPMSSAPEVDEGTKIAVYLNSASNLVVVSGTSENDTTATTKDTGTKVTPGEWVRLTISKAGENSFKVHVDDTQVGGTYYSLTGEGGVSSIGFQGSGALDNFVARTTDPHRSTGYGASICTVPGYEGSDIEKYGYLWEAVVDTLTDANGPAVIRSSGDYYDGGRDYKPYEIFNADCLKALADGVLVNPAVRSLNFVQTANIDMASAGAFPGIGESGDDVTKGIAFAGVYDGGGFTISNVTLEPNEYAGVFRKVTGTVKNLTVNNMGFASNASDSFGCAIVGEADNNAVLQNLTATGSFCTDEVKATHNTAAIVVNVQTAVGNGTVTIESCTNNATVYGSHHRVGGILAYTRGEGNVNIIDCANNGNLNWTIKGTKNPPNPRGIAGIAACPEGTGYISIENCVNTGTFTVTGATNAVTAAAVTGEIVGHIYKGTLNEGGNTFHASKSFIGGVESAASVAGATYAVAADAEGYLTTVAQADLAAGNTYVLLSDVAASETPVFTLDAAGDTIAFDTAAHTFAGTIAVANPNMMDVSDSTEGTVTTYTAVGGTAVASITKDETTTSYNTIAKALDDAEADDTVVLESDSAEDVSLPTGVSFATNGKNYSGTVTAAAGNGYVAVMDANGMYAVVDNTASTWKGETGGLWATAANWSTGVVPDQYTTVTFNGDADVGIGATDDVRSVAALVVNGEVTFHHDSHNYAYYPSVQTYGNVTGSGTVILERCGLRGNGSEVTVGCDLVFKGDSATSHDSFLQNGPFVINGDVSSTIGRLHLITPVTFNGGVNLENATMTSTVSGGAAPTFNGAVTLGTGATISTYAVTYNNALTIGEGAIVSVGSTSQTYGENFTMTGSGRFIGDTQMPGSKVLEALTQSTWTGTLELKGMTIKQTNGLQTYGNADSKVCFNNVTTYLHRDGNAVGGIEVGAGGLKVNGTYSAGDWNLPELSGVGTFTVGTAGNGNKNFNFPADCSEFSGSIAFASDTANTRVVFGTTDREFKEKTICVGSDAVVGAGATWTASDEIYLDGIVKASANTSLSTVVGSGKIVYGAVPTGTHTFGEDWSGIGALDYKGDSRIDLADYVNTIAQKCSCDTVEVVEGCTMSLNNYFGADVTPTLKVSGFVTINDGSSTNKRKISNLTGDGVLVFGTKGAMVNYAVDNVVGWNGVITNSASATLITNLVSGSGTVVYKAAAAAMKIGDEFDGEVEYAVSPSAAPVVGDNSEATVYLNFNYAGMNIAPYGKANSTIKLGDLSAANAYLDDGSGSGTGRIPSKVIVAGDVTINNGYTQYPSFDWTGSKTLQFNDFTVDGSFVLLSTRAWNDAQCYYYIKSLNGDGAGSITVGAGYSLRIDAVDFAEAPSGDDCIVPLTVGAAADSAAAGNLYGADGVLNGPIPVTVNGVATEQSLVYDATKNGLVLYVPPAQVTIDIPTVDNTTPSVTADGEPVEIVNGQITVTDGAAIVLTYTSTTHEVTNGTIQFTAAAGYTVDASGVTTAAYVAKIDGGSVSYTSLQAAIDATAQSNSKVVLVADESIGATVPAVNGKAFFFYAGSYNHGEILNAPGNFITTVTEEQVGIGGETVTAAKYRVESAFMAVTISGTRTLYGMASANAALAVANAGPLGTTVEFFSEDPASYAASLPMFTYNEQTGIYTKTLEPVAAVYSGVLQLSVHTSLADAVGAADAGQTVKLLANVTLDARVNVAKSVTIDLAGYSITRTAAPNGDNGSAFRVDGAYTVTIKGGAIDCSGVDDATVLGNGVFAIDAKNGAALSLTNLTVTVDSKNGACVYAWSGSTVTILDGTYANTTQENYQYEKFQEAKGMAVNQANVATQLLTIYGGSFKQIDPSLGDDSASGCSTFLASGYAATWNPSTGYWIVSEKTGPSIVDGDEDPVDVVVDGTTIKVDPATAATEITVSDAEGYTIEVPVSVDQVSGVADANIKVVSGANDITGAFSITDGAIVLDENGSVTINEETIAVKPTFTDAGDETVPFAVGDDVSVGVKTIPGLTYTLKRGTSLGTYTDEVAEATATGSRLSLTDNSAEKPTTAFYVIEVTK